MIIAFTILHIIVCLLLCGIVLMQSGKGGGLSGAFGGGGGMQSQMFGAKAMNTAMTKLTSYLAIAFFVTSSILFVLTKDRVESTFDPAAGQTTEQTSTDQQPVPVTPADVDADAGAATTPTTDGEETPQ